MPSCMCSNLKKFKVCLHVFFRVKMELNMSTNNKGKRKVLTQRHVCSRMNFLYQAANLMAHSNNSTLAAYYGKLCRNVGTKSLMHMSPALKRTLCKRCSQPLLPGINTMLKLEGAPTEQQQEESQETKEPNSSDKNTRRRRKRRKRESNEIVDNNLKLYLECSLCQAKRSFHINTEHECWTESSEAIVQTVCLDHQQAGVTI